mmetsp:Transcript_12932/g.17407  ORF Transcript_12932/g.17407 Transcript_12932/m.17407 type:complete len:104 (-) Transcript_12932:1615-1926(-)
MTRGPCLPPLQPLKPPSVNKQASRQLKRLVIGSLSGVIMTDVVAIVGLVGDHLAQDVVVLPALRLRVQVFVTLENAAPLLVLVKDAQVLLLLAAVRLIRGVPT